jgi:hypothetical protein
MTHKKKKWIESKQNGSDTIGAFFTVKTIVYLLTRLIMRLYFGNEIT